MKLTAAAVAILLASSFSAFAEAPAGSKAAPSSANCASIGDPGNVCTKWNGTACAVDVEKMPSQRCDYNQASTADMDGDHKPMCYSVGQQQHMIFSSSRSRKFRVRRLVPITATNAKGQPCPPDPFRQAFDPHNIQFGDNADSLAPKAAAIGCKYKLEVQFSDIDNNAPPEQDGKHYECRDPHLGIVN